VSLWIIWCPITGHIAQMRGDPTREQYKATTVFANHHSDITFVHLHKTTNVAETIEAKEDFEHWAASFGSKITHYHADNGCFAATAFMARVAKCRQTISFLGVNAHFQHGRAEQLIRTLQDLAQLFHAKARWPIAITDHLWPYTILNVANMQNDMPRIGNTHSCMDLFAGTDVQTNLKHHHHIGIPAYVLDANMQAGRNISK
jgi:hypothetical protein